MMYDDVQEHHWSCRPQPREGTLKPNTGPSRGQPGKLMVPPTKTDTPWNSFFPSSATSIWNDIPSSAFSSNSSDALVSSSLQELAFLPKSLSPQPAPNYWTLCSNYWAYLSINNKKRKKQTKRKTMLMKAHPSLKTTFSETFSFINIHVNQTRHRDYPSLKTTGKCDHEIHW